MQTQNISFCDNVGLNIKSNDTKQKIINDLDEIDIRIIDKHHEIFDKDRHDKRLTRVPHFIGVKSNGNPYYMYLTKINFVNSIVMIDKKIQMGYTYPRMIIIRLTFNDNELFDNTLIEGEMIKDNDNEWLYLVSDIHMFKKKSVKDTDLFKKMNMINDFLENNFVTNYEDLFNIQLKKYVPFSQLMTFNEDFIPTLKYTCRGLYLKPLYSKFKDILLNFNDNLVNKNLKPKFKSKYDFVTNETMKKELKITENRNIIIKHNFTGQTMKKSIEPNENKFKNEIPSNIVKINIETTEKQHTEKEINNCIFQIQKTEIPDLYKLYDNDNKYIGNACIDSLKTSKMLNSHFQNMTMIEKTKFECVKTNNKHLSTIWVPVGELFT